MYGSYDELTSRYDEKKLLAWSGQDKEKILTALSDASYEIDDKLHSAGYELPLVAVPPSIIKYAVDIAAYNILTASGIAEEDYNKTVLDRAEKARSYLNKVALGKCKIAGLKKDSGSIPITSNNITGGVNYITTGKIDLSGRVF